MARSLQATVGFLIFALSAGAATPAIGTVSAPGSFHLDSYAVRNSATLFNGSVLETEQAPADVTLSQNVRIRLAATSRGTIYADRMVLLAGESEVAAARPFAVNAIGLTVMGSDEAKGRVVIHADHTVQVSAMTGELAVKDDSGKLLAELHPGNSLTFAEAADGQPAPAPQTVTVSGILVSQNGKLYLQETGDIRYELVGNIPLKLVGKKIVVRGVKRPGMDGGPPQLQVSAYSEASKVGGMPTATKWIIIGTAGTAAAIPIIYYATHNGNPASR
jgi:hypothetical protein